MLPENQILRNISLKTCNTLSIDAKSSFYVRLTDLSFLSSVIKFSISESTSVRVIGGGSNVILGSDFCGLTLQMSTKGYEVISQTNDDIVIEVQAGVIWHEFVEWSLANQYYGLENLALIPGTVGASPIQNIGAYGREVSDVVISVKGVDLANPNEQLMTLSRTQCCFGYRHSIFKTQGFSKFLITSVVFKLKKKNDINIEYRALKEYLMNRDMTDITPRDVFDAVCDIRQNKLPDPLYEPNVGSFFKNPIISLDQYHHLKNRFPKIVSFPVSAEVDGEEKIKVAAAWLIDYCGWKGASNSKVKVSSRQALVLINKNGNGQDVLSFAKKIQESVFQVFGIYLEIEPKIY